MSPGIRVLWRDGILWTSGWTGPSPPSWRGDFAARGPGRSTSGEQLGGSLLWALYCPPQCREVGEGGTKSLGVPGHENPAEGARAVCQAAETEGDHLGVHPGRRGAHPGRSLWKGVQSDTCHFEALQLSLKNMCKLRPLLEKWVEEADNNENLQEICKSETLVQARKRKRTSIEKRVRWNLENMFLQCPKPSLQQITTIAKQLGLERDVVRVWFCNWRQKGKRSSIEYSQREEYESAVKPFPGGAMSFPLPPGPHFGAPGYGSPHFTTLYSVPFPEGEAFPSVPVTALGSPMHSN